MMKPIIIIAKSGHLSHDAWKEFKESIANVKGLTDDYHVLTVDGAEHTHVYFFEPKNI